MEKGPLSQGRSLPGKTAHFEGVMAGFTSSGAWSSFLVLAKRGPRSQVVALMSEFYHENEWNESSEGSETGVKQANKKKGP
jgi:hypothetical protein